MVKKYERYAARRAPFLKSIALRPNAPEVGYPWELAAVRNLAQLDFTNPITFLVGDNGSGKSTLTEAIATGTGFNSEGGNRHYLIEEQDTVSPLRDFLDMQWATKPRHGWFLRAESFYNIATFIEDDPDIARWFDAKFHRRSHGESFIDLAIERFGGNGLYVLDEPEAALSFQGNLRLLTVIHDTLKAGGQFIIATHSPLLMSYPGAAIFEVNDAGFVRREFRDVEAVELWGSFFQEPERFLRHLFG